VIGTFEGSIDFADYRDDYQEGLREIIDAKIAGREIVAPEVQEPPTVVNLMEALRRRLDAISGAPKKPAPMSSSEPLTAPASAGRTAARSSSTRRRRTA